MKGTIEIGPKILEFLESMPRDKALKVLAEVVVEYDLDFVAELLRKDFEPKMTAESLYESNAYDEGDDTAGHVSLCEVLEFAEDVLTHTSKTGLKILFNYFVRPETSEERQENEHMGCDTWYTARGDVKISDLELQFETE